MTPRTTISIKANSYASRIKLHVLWIFLSALASSCSFDKNRGAIEYICSTKEVSETEILPAIEQSLKKLSSGIENKDAKEIFSIMADQDKSIYIRDGKLSHGVKASIKEYQSYFDSHPEHQRKFYFKEKDFQVVNSNTVFFNGIGVIETIIDGDKKQEDWKIAYSILWLNSSEGWKASSMHISW